MITYKPIVLAKRKDNTYPVRIRVTFKGVSRKLRTSLVATPSDLTRTGHIKNPDLLNKAERLIAEMRAVTAGLSSFVVQGWTIDRVVAYIETELSSREFRLDFFEYAERFLQSKGESTRRPYDAALRSLRHFAGDLDINDITKALLLAWRDSVSKGRKMYHRGDVWKETSKPQGKGQATRMLDKIAHIYRAAQLEYNDDDRVLIPRNPFAGIRKVVPPAQGQKNLGPELIQKIIEADCEGQERVALDAFLLSFATMGANMADLWDAKPQLSRWVYNRRKTKNRRQDGAIMRVDIPKEVSGIIGRLQTGPAGWWLPALHLLGSTSDRCTAKVNYWLRRWAARNGIEPFTFYAARHSWASIARKLGVEKATIDECLCHVGDYRMTDIYAERNFDLMNAANRKVVESFRWP